MGGAGGRAGTGAARACPPRAAMRTSGRPRRGATPWPTCGSRRTRWARCGARGAPVRRTDPTRGRELQGVGPPHAGAVPDRARPREVGVREGQRGPRAARAEAREGHPGCGRRGDRGEALRRVPHRRLPDGLGHLVQHEHERGDLEPREPRARRKGRREEAGPSERPREHGAVEQRRDPHDAAPLGGAGREGAPAARPRAPRQRAPRQEQGVRRRGQGRPDAPPGRDARPHGPGVRRVGRADGARRAAPRARVDGLLEVALGGTAVGTGIGRDPDSTGRRSRCCRIASG